MKKGVQFPLPNAKSGNGKFDLKLILYVTLFYSIVFCVTFRALGQEISPTEWKFESQRNEIAPISSMDDKTTFHGKSTLMLSGGGKEYADGHWYTVVDVKPGDYFQFRAYFIASNVEEPDRSVLASIVWQDGSGKQVGFQEYPLTLLDKKSEGWSIIEQIYKIPSDAKKAKLELHYRWDADGTVHFGGISFQKTVAPPTRMVRLATIHHRPRGTKSSQEGLDQFAELVAKAGAQKADIVCLPEGITIVGTQLDYISASEPVPGPTTRFLGDIARKNNLYIVAGILERKGEAVYNTAVLIDRSGKLAGTYHKVSLPREEIDGGVTPGDALPVFDTDFGRIGMMICWDVTFPEQARTLTKQGAEVIFLPIWGGNLVLAKARAIENQVYLVSSTYDMISAVFDQEGEVMKEATDSNPVVAVDVDLNKQKLWPWLGDFKNRIQREMPSQKAIRSKPELQ
jgi:predicted amidohydrolase